MIIGAGTLDTKGGRKINASAQVLDTDDRFSFTFAKPGQFSYFCSLHPHMTGKIVVKA